MKKIVVFVPIDHADALRRAMGGAGAGKLGTYAFCSFSSKGVARFTPLPGSHPSIGEVGQAAHVEEERIECMCPDAVLSKVIAAIKAAHPYEEPAIEVWTVDIP